jgi:predicted ABC-type ATPase
MFAGPNGSGKSTVKEIIAKKNPRWFGVYINPDEIEKTIEEEGLLNFGLFKIKTNENEIFDSLNKSTVLAEKGLLSQIPKLEFHKNTLSLRTSS